MTYRRLGTAGLYFCLYVSADPCLECVAFTALVSHSGVADLVGTFLLSALAYLPVRSVFLDIFYADDAPFFSACALVAFITKMRIIPLVLSRNAEPKNKLLNTFWYLFSSIDARPGDYVVL